MDINKTIIVGNTLIRVAAWAAAGTVTAIAIKRTGNLKAGWVMLTPLLMDFHFSLTPPKKAND